MKPSIVLLLLGWLATAPAWAQLSVASCSATATSVPFGSYDPTSATPLTPTGSVSVSCNLIAGVSLLVAYTVTLSTGSSGSYITRKMTGTATPMNYNLYLNGSWTQVWGDGVSGGSVSKSDGYLLGLGSVSKSYTVYAKLPAQQLVAAGGYADSIVVSISY
jgi:spore coat protein U-like protein